MKANKLNKAVLSALVFGVAMGFGGVAYAASISCNPNDAMANGAYADDCEGTDSKLNGDLKELIFVNNTFTGAGTIDDFFFADKSETGTTNGFTLTVTENPDFGDPPPADGEFLFLYSLVVPTEYVGLTADFVLGVKQASDSFIAYLFNDVVLGIEGGFNSFWFNPQGKEVNDYSHATSFLRVTSDNPPPPPPPPQGAPEPGMLLLMGAGLLGLGMARRRKSA